MRAPAGCSSSSSKPSIASSRNLVDQERMVRRLEFIGVRLIGFADGYDSALKAREIMRAVRGSFNEEQLRVIAAKTHRGLSGQVARGYHAGASPMATARASPGSTQGRSRSGTFW